MSEKGSKSINELFSEIVSVGYKTAQSIFDPQEKAKVLAELAKALAMTGLVTAEDKANDPDMKEVKEVLSGKAEEPVKKKEKPAKAKTEEPKKEEAPADSGEPELTEEWTEEMKELKQEQIEFIQEITEQFGKETVDECVQNFSEGVLKSVSDITPLNIDAFVAYIKMLLEEAEEEE